MPCSFLPSRSFRCFEPSYLVPPSFPHRIGFQSYRRLLDKCQTNVSEMICPRSHSFHTFAASFINN